MNTQKTYVIVGSSAAGVGALLKLRQLDPQARIICITAEAQLPYNKCHLADYVSGILPYNDLFLLTEQRIQELAIDLRLNTTVIAIDRAQKKVVTNTHQEVSYDTLLLALGSSPFIPPIVGINVPNVFTFHTLDEVDRILNYSTEKQIDSITVVGGGITGIECADAFFNSGKKITIIERTQRLLAHVMPGEQSSKLQEAMQHKGINLWLNEQIAEIQVKHGLANAISTSAGVSIPTQLLIVATGVKGNTHLAHHAGLNVATYGLIVDDYFKTNDPFIFAAGDMIETTNQLNGHIIPTRLWPDAMNQGMRAAMAMAGAAVKPYPGIMPLIKSHFVGFDYLSFGWNNTSNADVMFHSASAYHVALQVVEEKITAISVLGKGFDISLCRQAVLTNMSVDEYLEIVNS